MSARASRHVHASALDQGTRLVSFMSARRLCLVCESRRPLFRHQGVVKADADHTLCFECYRALLQRVRAVRLVTGAWLPALRARPAA